MPFRINKAILHIIDREGGARLSNQELDVDSEACYQFVQKHVKKLLTHPGAKEACFSAESAVYGLTASYIKQEMYFKDLSHKLCLRLADILKDAESPLPADILIADFEDSRGRYLALVKLNYIECFTHRLSEGDHQIVVNPAILPFAGGKVEEAFLIPFEPMVLRVLEKPCAINGEETDYLSQLFLECETRMSKQEAAQIIAETAVEITEKYFEGDREAAARFSRAIIEEAERAETEDEGVLIENVVREAFGENEEAKQDFLELAKESGISNDVKLGKALARRQFGTQRFKADNGIEIKYPTELLEQPEAISFVTNADGSVTVTMRNLRSADQ
jgi:hypothetical protein